MTLPPPPPSTMALDLRPQAAAASTRVRVLRTALLEASLLLRNGEQLLLALVIPVAIVVGGRYGWGTDSASFARLIPAVIGLAIWSSAFTSVAISTGFDRRYGVLERLAATPLGRTGLLLGKTLAIGLVVTAQSLVLVIAALALGWRPQPWWPAVALSVPTVMACSVAFVAGALALASLVRAETTLALANLIYLAGAAAGGWQLAAYQNGQPVAWLSWLPTSLLLESLVSAWQHPLGTAGSGLSWTLRPLVALGWAAATVLIARKVMRWTS